MLVKKEGHKSLCYATVAETKVIDAYIKREEEAETKHDPYYHEVGIVVDKRSRNTKELCHLNLS